MTSTISSSSSSSSLSNHKKIVVLISGSGSNLQAILDACSTSTGKLHGIARVTQVISNRKAAFGLQRAQKEGIPTHILSLKTWQLQNPTKSRKDYDSVLAHCILAGAQGKASEQQRQYGGIVTVNDGQSNGNSSSISARQKPDLVVLAGFMHIVSPEFLHVLGDVPCINLHPALPGQFDGIQAIERAFEAFQSGNLPENTTGVMVHKVIAEVDAGEPIVVRRVSCEKGDSLQDLQNRIHSVEHEIIVEASFMILTGGNGVR